MRNSLLYSENNSVCSVCCSGLLHPSEPGDLSCGFKENVFMDKSGKPTVNDVFFTVTDGAVQNVFIRRTNAAVATGKAKRVSASESLFTACLLYTDKSSSMCLQE